VFYPRFILYLFIITGYSYAQQSFEEFKRQQEQAYNKFKESVTNEYNTFKAEEEAAFRKFKEDVEKQWVEFQGSTKSTYVSYDDDLQSRAAIDFEDGEVTIEVIIDHEQIEKDGLNYYNGSESNRFRFGYAGPSLIGNYLCILNTSFFAIPQTAGHVQKELAGNKTRPVLQKLADSMLMKKLVHLLSEKDDDGNAILENQLKNIEGVVVKPGLNDTEFAQEKVSQVLKDAKDYVGKDGKKRTSFSLNLKLRPDHKDVRINKYQKEISKQSKRFKINPAIAMAVTETESSFNPKATSPIPAYGLMQLVPASGARDAYTYVYGEDKFLGKRYLYKPNNNIELGCAYLGKIRHQYFQNIKDDEKALMCTVAAYNTGVGNVSRALTNSTKIAPAVKKVNKMSSQELYNTLLRDLKYEETRNYLKKVWERKEKYKA